LTAEAAEQAEQTKPARLAPTLAALTLARLMLNGARRFPYVILTPMAAALGVPRSTLETALSLEWATGAISPFAGPYIDRLGRKTIMLIGIGSLAFFAGIAALGQVAGVILFVLIATGLSKVLYDPAMQAYVGDRTPYRLRGMAIGITELSWSGALFVFGPLAAFLIDRGTVSAIFAVVAAGAALSFLLLAALLPNDAPRRFSDGAGVQARAMLRLLRDSRPAMALLIAAALMSVAAESMVIVYEAWLRNVFALSTVALGTLSWVISLAEVSGEGFVIGVADRLGKRRLAIAGLVATGICYFALPLTAGSLPAAVIALLLMFLTFEISIVVLIPVATEALPTARGTMMSSNVAALAGGRAIGTLVGGLLFRTGGYALNGTLALLLNLIAALLIWRFVHEYAGHQSAPATEPLP
jgi:predicted MFS family arabinose efflux permease